MRVWRAEAAEAGEVARLIAGFRDWMGKPAPSDAEILASVERIIAGGDGEFLLGAAAPDAAPDAVCQLRFRWSVWTSAEDAWLEDLYVREEARRTGLGRALVEGAVARAREHGCKRIELDVDEDNEPARALYAAAGFSDEPKGPGRSLFLGRPL